MGNDDELTGIFDDLKPEDFFGSTVGAAHVEPFSNFVDRMVETVRTAYLAAGGQVDSLAVLATGEREWSYVPNDEESLGDYLERLRLEAKRLSATRLFVIRRTMVGSQEIPAEDAEKGEVFDVGHAQRIAEAVEDGRMVEGVFYYASCSEGAKVTRYGIMRSSGARLSEPVEAEVQQAVTHYDSILGSE